eukprot:6655361-Pyramimonas_sp.AAC.1
MRARSRQNLDFSRLQSGSQPLDSLCSALRSPVAVRLKPARMSLAPGGYGSWVAAIYPSIYAHHGGWNGGGQAALTACSSWQALRMPVK